MRRAAADDGANDGAEDGEGAESGGEAPLPIARVVAAVTKHQVYRGAKPGSLDNVWFGIKYTDGSATGRRRRPDATHRHSQGT